MTGPWNGRQVGICATVAAVPLTGRFELSLGLVLLAGFLCGGAYFTWYGLSLASDKYGVFRLWFRIRNTPTVTVQSLPVGEVHVEGRLRPTRDPQTTPFYGTPCAYGCWAVMRVRDGTEETVAADDTPGRMRLTDETGEVLVEQFGDPVAGDAGAVDILVRRMARQDREAYAVRYEGAGYRGSVRIAPSGVQEVTVEAGEQPPERIAEWCARQGLDSVVSETRRYRELVVPPGATVYVHGQARRRAGDEEAATDSDLVIGADEETRAFLADRPEAETLDRLAWEWRLRFALSAVFLLFGVVFIAVGLRMAWGVAAEVVPGTI